MCSRLLQKMENYQGDLTDILRAGSASTAGIAPPAEQVSAAAMIITDEWQFPASSTKDFLPIADQESLDEFGDPFSNMRDPLLLHQIHMPPPATSPFFSTSTSNTTSTTSSTSFPGGGGGGGGNNNTMLVSQRITGEEISQTCKTNNNNSSSIFSTMSQIPPNAKLPVFPLAAATSPLVTNESSDTCAPVNSIKGSLENGGPAQQISSPRNTGMKRR